METTEVVPVTPETPAVTPAPVETASVDAAPVSGETTPESQEKPAKTFTQAELDAIVAREKAKAERKVRRELTAPVQAAHVPDNEPAKPVISNYQTVDEYDQAMTKWSDDRVVARQTKQAQETQAAQQVREVTQLNNAFADREEAAQEKYPDYVAVAHNPRLPITNEMAETIKRLPQGPDVVYFLGQNLGEAARIAQLHPDLQRVEIGRIEAKLSLPAPAPKKSSAPEPINPVSPNASGGAIDTRDPKSLEKLGTSAWINAERDRQRKAWEQKTR